MKPALPVVAIVLAVLGAAVMVWSFGAGVSAALDSGGSGAGGYIAVFLIAAAAVLVALVLGIIGLVRGRGTARVLSGIAVVLALLPAIGVVVLRIVAIG